VPFDLTLQDLIEIATDECPILHTPFVWGASGLGKGKTRPDSPTLDRILPELGYIKGNVAFLSYRANRIKDNGTMQEHYDIADWIWNHTHAKENTTTPVPAGDYQQGEIYPELGPFSATGTWEDNNNPDHHCGADARQDADHRTQKSSGDSVGRGGEEVATPIPLESFQDYGLTKEQVRGIIEDLRRIPDKP
jgi:hypothetical protein